LFIVGLGQFSNQIVKMFKPITSSDIHLEMIMTVQLTSISCAVWHGVDLM
jgi:hypothetical protein